MTQFVSFDDRARRGRGIGAIDSVIDHSKSSGLEQTHAAEFSECLIRFASRAHYL